MRTSLPESAVQQPWSGPHHVLACCLLMGGLSLPLAATAIQAQGTGLAVDSAKTSPSAAAIEAQDVWAAQRERLMDLLARDTDRALANLEAQSRNAWSAGEPVSKRPEALGATNEDPAVNASPKPAQLRLRGLYGIEPRFTVLLEVDGVLKLYRPGATLPLNGNGAEHEFRLLRVRDRCVVLRLGTAQPRTACYHNPLSRPVSARDANSSTEPWGDALNAPLPDFARPQ